MARFSIELFINIEATNIKAAIKALKFGLYRSNLPEFTPISVTDVDTNEEWDESTVSDILDSIPDPWEEETEAKAIG